MSREYDQLAWVDYPETLTPISAANLNRMENGIANLYTDRNKMENNIAYVEEGEEATRHYFINSYLMLNGIFYKTVSEINVGDLLDYGLDGNIEHVDISSQFGSGGGGSTGCVEITQAQYDALSDEAKMLDVIYLITDSPDNYLDEVFGDFATVEYTDTASKAYAVGDYLVYDSKFYRVTSAIAQGDTIVPDTNVVKTTVADEFSNASNVDYSNTTSGLTATNVQDAVDEVVSDLGEATGSWVGELLSSQTYGSLVGYINAKLKIAIIYWAGNSVTPSAGEVTITIPNKYKPVREFVVPMKDNATGGWLAVTTAPMVRLTLSGTFWSNATVMYPLA